MSSTRVQGEDDTEPPRRTGRSVPFAGVVLASLALCALTAVLPGGMPWWPLKLAAASYAVLLLPGAVILRALGWPRSPAAALAASSVWSITAVAPGLVLAFVLDRGLDAVLLWLLAVIVVGLVAGRGKPVAVEVRVTPSVVLLAGTVVAFAGLLALARWDNTGDAVEHIARIRKLTELNPLRSLSDVNLLPPSTGLHPGYAFPLWHAVVGLITRISGVDEAIAFRSLPPLLIPIMAAAIYRAGRSMFGCRAAGVAVWVAYLALFAFPHQGVGYFDKLAYPGYVSIFLLWPLVVDRAFVFLRSGGREPVLTIAAASFVVTVIHASYTPFMMLLVGAFAAARFATARRTAELPRLAILLAAVSVPFLLLLAWLYPLAKSAGATAGDVNHFATLLDQGDTTLRIKPGFVTRGGPAYIAALLLAPIAAAATRTRAGAFLASGVAAVVLILIVPLLFTPFSDVMSVSQARRMVFFLPWAFALVGGALVLARFKHVAVVAAFGAAWFLHALYPGEFSYRMRDPGPEWVAWFGALAVLAVLVAGAAGKLHLRYREAWTVPIILAFTLPIAVAGLPETKLGQSDPTGFPGPVLTAIRQNVDRDDVVLAPKQVAYRLTSRAPVYTVAVTEGHSADTFANRHAERRADVDEFFKGDIPAPEAEEIIERWDVSWVLVDKSKPYPDAVVGDLTPVFEGASYALYPVEEASSGS